MKLNVPIYPRLLDSLFYLLIGLATGLSMVILFFILSTVIWRGAPALSLDFLFTPARGMEGGIYYQILGTFILIMTTAVVVTPFSYAIALVQTFYLKTSFLGRWILLGLHAINATPSILFGILGFMFFVKGLNWSKSWLSGGIILAFMILPAVTIAIVDRLETIPRSYLEQARAMGFNDDQLAWGILIPYGWGGFLTGLVLGLSRAAGETAPILFTAVVFSGATIPTGIVDNPVLALPYHIFNLAQDAFSPSSTASLWATAACLTAFVLFTSLLAIPFRKRSHEEARK